MYLLDFDATMTLITGYDARRRALVIKRWRELEERAAKPADPMAVPDPFGTGPGCNVSPNLRPLAIIMRLISWLSYARLNVTGWFVISQRDC